MNVECRLIDEPLRDESSRSAPLVLADPIVTPRSAQDGGITAAILTRVKELTVPASLPKRWEFLRASSAMRQLAGAPHELVTALEAEFGRDALSALGLVRRYKAGSFVLSPVLGDRRTSFLIAGDKSRTPIDILSCRGELAKENRVLRLAGERATARGAYEEPVFLAASDVELHLLLRLGLRFTPAAGLPALTGPQIRKLFAEHGKERQQRKYTLVIMGCQLADGVRAPSQASIDLVNVAAKIGAVYGVDPSIVFEVWQPTAADFRAIMDACQFRDGPLVKKLLRASAKTSRLSPAAMIASICDSQPLSVPAARARLADSVRRSASWPLVAEVDADLARYTKIFEADILDKLTTSAGDSPLQSVTNATVVDRARTWFDCDPVVVAAKKIVQGSHPGRIDGVDPSLFDHRLRAVTDIGKLLRMLRPA